jgi:hypothetical protein
MKLFDSWCIHTAVIFAITQLAGALSPVLAADQPRGGSPVAAQQENSETDDVALKAADDLMWQLKLGDIAEVDKFAYTSLPPAREPNPTAQGAGNPMIVYAYSFITKKLDKRRRTIAAAPATAAPIRRPSTTAGGRTMTCWPRGPGCWRITRSWIRRA